MIHETADVEPTADLGSGVHVWHHAHIRDDAVIGDNTVIGAGAYIGVGVHLGSNCKIQNGAQIYEPAWLANGVFVGPQAVLTNDRFPRAITPGGTLKSKDDWNAVGVAVHHGATIGAHATIIAPVTIGAWAMVGAGSVVTKDVPSYALMVGTPAIQVGWISESGYRLSEVSGAEKTFSCPVSGAIYEEFRGSLRRISSG